MTSDDRITERQRRERDYHKGFAELHRDKIAQPVLMDVVEDTARRPWNGYWSTYDALIAFAPQGKRVLVPGCGFGDDAIRLARLGATVCASDLSPEIVEIARHRAAAIAAANIRFDVLPAERMDYADNSFDLIFFNDILHHVDIPTTLTEARRVLRPGGTLIANELYTHSALQSVRESRLVRDLLYPRLVRFVYGTNSPYCTEDERKLDEHELAMLRGALGADTRTTYFQLLAGRLAPSYWPRLASVDRHLLNLSDGIGRRLAGRVLVVGTIRK
jgi:SAM-dependent methyltransferase